LRCHRDLLFSVPSFGFFKRVELFDNPLHDSILGCHADPVNSLEVVLMKSWTIADGIGHLSHAPPDPIACTIEWLMDFTRVLLLVGGFMKSVGQPFAVIGALGLAARGLSRSTFDVDIVVPIEAQPRLLNFLESQGYICEHVSSGYSNHSHPDQELGRLDVVYVQGDTAQMIFDGVSMHDGPGGVSIPVPRPEHLAAMKVFAIKNNPRRVLQDLEDLQQILRLPGVDRDEIVAYMKKNDMEALLDRLE
jgi:hypothetical protein